MSIKTSAISIWANGSGLYAISAGFELCKKPDKTEFEEKAAKGFKRLLLFITISICALLIGSFVTVVQMICTVNGDGKIFSSYTERTGHVEDGQVWYIQNTKKIVSLDELGISTENIVDGNDVILFFDSSTDELQFAKTKKQQETEEKYRFNYKK